MKGRFFENTNAKTATRRNKTQEPLHRAVEQERGGTFLRGNSQCRMQGEGTQECSGRRPIQRGGMKTE